MSNSTTLDEYKSQLQICRDIFYKKTCDYGTSWKVFRTITLADQLFIKAWRIRQIQEGLTPKVNEDIRNEWRGIVNYGIIGKILLSQKNEDVEYSVEEVMNLYDKYALEVQNLMLDKNHDYGEAWRHMSQESFIDLILTKILRIRQINSNDGKTSISEGIDSNYSDIINYALFALILYK